MNQAPHAARTSALGSESLGENRGACAYFVPPGDFPRELRERD
jgi:hypothetical protein